MTRPAKLTPDVQTRLCDAIVKGNYMEAACDYAGIDDSTFRRWMQRGERENGIYGAFRAAVKKAHADSEMRMVARWQKHTPEDWRACRDFLARRFPERWGERKTHEVTGPDGGAVKVEHTIDLKELTDAELDQYEALAAAAFARRGTNGAVPPK